MNEPSNKVRIFYLRDSKRFPVACIASKLEGNKLKYALSTHNPRDPYDKAMARNIAETRLALGRVVIERNTRKPSFPPLQCVGGSILLGDEPTKEIKAKLLQEIATSSKLPQRATDAAKLWLESRKS